MCPSGPSAQKLLPGRSMAFSQTFYDISLKWWDLVRMAQGLPTTEADSAFRMEAETWYQESCWHAG